MEMLARKTTWLKSPVQNKADGLRMGTEIEIRPYMGRRRRVRLMRTEYSIGNGSDASIFLDDPFVSKSHGALIFNSAQGNFSVKNGDSKNGIYLNGVKIECAALPSRGVLKIGRSEVVWREETVNDQQDIGGLIVADEKMREVLNKLKEAARSNLPILILGETGTGKELIARLIHNWSHRAREKIVTVNGATLGGSLAESELFGHRKGAFTGSIENRRGAIQMAHRGSLFIDEVGDIHASAQIKLLRALESGELKALGSDQLEASNFRLISATSRPLRSLVREEKFRLDLYYRIAGYVVEIPPLRERREDIRVIANHMMDQAGFRLSFDGLEKLMMHDWFGNVRELRATVERALVEVRLLGVTEIEAKHIHLDHGEVTSPLKKIVTDDCPISLEELEKRFIISVLSKNAGSRKLSANQLGISRTTLFKKMNRYGIPTGPRGYESKHQ